MDVPALAAREHANLVEAMCVVAANAPGGFVRREDGVTLFATGLPVRLFNQVLVDDDDATPAAVVAAVEVARGRGIQYAVNLRRGFDDRFVGLMGELGLGRLSDDPWMPGMALHPLPAPASTPAPPGCEIRLVEDVRGLDDHIRVLVEGFGMPAELVRVVVNPGLLGRPGVALYVGYADGAPVTSGLGMRTGATVGVYNIATLARARRRGYGAAMTARIAADGAAAGCDVAILQASDMGRQVYERLGYRTVVEYDGYADPPG